MVKKIRLILSFLIMAVGLAACRKQITTDIPEYTIEATTVSPVELNDYAIKDAASFLSIGKLAQRPESRIVTACFYDETSLAVLYLSEDSYTATVSRLSLTTGESEDMGMFIVDNGDEYMSLSFICLNPVTIQNTNDGKLYILDENGKITDSRIDGTAYSQLVCSNGTAYGVNKDNVNIDCINLETGNIYSIYQNGPEQSGTITGINQIIESSNELALIGFDKTTLTECTYMLDIDTGSLTRQMHSVEQVYDDEDNIYMIDNRDASLNILRRSIKDFNNVAAMSYSKDVFIDYINIYGDSVVMEEYGDEGLIFRFGDLNKEQLIASSELKRDACNSFYGLDDTEGYEVYPAYSGINDYSESLNMMVFMISGSNVNDIVLWDINSAVEGSLSIAADTYADDQDYSVTEITDYGELSVRIADIYEKYGVEVCIGDNAAQYYSGYNAERLTDYSIMEQGIDSLESVLDKYPDNFFRYMVSGDYLRGILVYFNGVITPASTDSISSAAAFATKDKNYELLVFDTNQTYSMEMNAAHEISHAIFDRIEYDESMTGVTYFDYEEWNKLNPPGFEYVQSYFSESGEEYDVSGDNSNTSSEYYNDWILDNVYFVDSYSKTYVTEDLARLMENAMNMDIAGEYMQSSHIKAKLSYYFKAIRNTWDTTGWPQITTWEEAMQ